MLFARNSNSQECHMELFKSVQITNKHGAFSVSNVVFAVGLSCVAAGNRARTAYIDHENHTEGRGGEGRGRGENGFLGRTWVKSYRAILAGYWVFKVTEHKELEKCYRHIKRKCCLFVFFYTHHFFLGSANSLAQRFKRKSPVNDSP
jgi:hypothetical protein